MKLSSFFNYYPHLRQKIVEAKPEIDSYGYPVDLTIVLLRNMESAEEIFYTPQKRISKALFFDNLIPFLLVACFLGGLLLVAILVSTDMFFTQYQKSAFSVWIFLSGFLLFLCCAAATFFDIFRRN